MCGFGDEIGGKFVTGYIYDMNRRVSHQRQ